MKPVRAIILAAGRGERMRPLTDTTPKPLLPVRGKPMIEWHLEALAAAGVGEVVINTAWLEDRFVPALGDGSRWGLRIIWSFERRDFGGALETAGGIATALPWLAPTGREPFWVVSGDIHCPSFSFSQAALVERLVMASQTGAAVGHLWLVENPDFHPRGDFVLDTAGLVRPLESASSGHGTLTYANVALLTPELVARAQPGVRAPLGPHLKAAAARGALTGEKWDGPWENVGTPEQWQALQ